MTTHRRPLLLSAAAAALVCPACLFIPAQSTPITSPEMREKIAAEAKRATETPRKDVFGELPSRPGETVAARSAPKPSAPVAYAPSSPSYAPAAPTLPGDLQPVSLYPVLPSVAPPPALTPGRESPLLDAVKAYADGKPTRAIEILKSLDGPNQEFVLAVVPILQRGATADLAADPAAVAALVDQLEAIAARLGARAALKIENLAFCTKVAGFGRYDPWPEGQPYHPNDQAQLYLEVENLVSQPAAGPHGETHVTHAKVAVEIKDAHGVLVKQADPEDWRRRVEVAKFEKKLPSRGPVRDFHVLYPFAVPTAPGVYTVSVEVRDPTGRKARSAPKEFRVTGP
jgi:hypothetical protein